MSSNPKAAINKYKKNNTTGKVENANPHRLIQMLLEGATEKISQAKYYMQQGEIADKGEHISWAISIIDGLKISIDVDAGGEISKNLLALYDYIQTRLIEANAENNTDYLDEVLGLLNTVTSAWKEIPDEHRNVGQASIPVQNSITSTTA